MYECVSTIIVKYLSCSQCVTLRECKEMNVQRNGKHWSKTVRTCSLNTRSLCHFRLSPSAGAACTFTLCSIRGFFSSSSFHDEVEHFDQHPHLHVAHYMSDLNCYSGSYEPRVYLFPCYSDYFVICHFRCWFHCCR